MASNFNFSLESLGCQNTDVLSALIALQQQQQQTQYEQQGVQAPEMRTSEEQFEERGGEKESVPFEKEAFLEAVRELPCLWNVNSHSYKDRAMKNNAWKSLSSMFNQEITFLQKQLKNLRDMLKKCLDKRNRMSRSGAAACNLPKCQYFDQMAFLHEKSANKPTESNLSPAPDPLGNSFSADSVLSPLSPGISNSISTEAPKSTSQPSRKRRNESQESALTQSLAECDAMLNKAMEDDNDEDSLYCRSLIPIMRELPKKQKRLAKIKISQLLFDL